MNWHFYFLCIIPLGSSLGPLHCIINSCCDFTVQHCYYIYGITSIMMLKMGHLLSFWMNIMMLNMWHLYIHIYIKVWIVLLSTKWKSQVLPSSSRLIASNGHVKRFKKTLLKHIKAWYCCNRLVSLLGSFYCTPSSERNPCKMWYRIWWYIVTQILEFLTWRW
jgi:hypothetical protein